MSFFLHIDKKHKHGFWKVRDCILNAFASIYLYHPTSDDESEDLRMHMSIDFLIFLEFVVFTGVIASKTDHSGLFLGIVWAAYLMALVLKVIFYMTQHPWSAILKDDLTNWKKLKEPKISHVKGPRKSKPLAILDRIWEGMLCDGTICSNGGSEHKEKKGNIFLNQVNFLGQGEKSSLSYCDWHIQIHTSKHYISNK